jgi:DNA-binding NarL/FixJ family response regulator
MNTRKILLISSDKELNGIVRISALTLTKLNCQISISETDIPETALKESSSANLDLIIIDLDQNLFEPLNLIRQIRNGNSSGVKKILSVFSENADRDAIYEAGCDSIMSKSEFKKVVNNILRF